MENHEIDWTSIGAGLSAVGATILGIFTYFKNKKNDEKVKEIDSDLATIQGLKDLIAILQIENKELRISNTLLFERQNQLQDQIWTLRQQMNQLQGKI